MSISGNNIYMTYRYDISFSVDYPQLDTIVLKPFWASHVSKVLAKFEADIISAYNGFSMIEHKGGYRNNNGNIVIENARTYIVCTDKDISGLYALIQELKESLSQESILLTSSKLDSIQYI